MAYLTIEINIPAQSIGTLNGTLAQGAGDSQLALNAIQNVVNGLNGGAHDGTVKIVVKDAASTINTSGTGSTSVTYDLS